MTRKLDRSWALHLLESLLRTNKSGIPRRYGNSFQYVTSELQLTIWGLFYLFSSKRCYKSFWFLVSWLHPLGLWIRAPMCVCPFVSDNKSGNRASHLDVFPPPPYCGWVLWFNLCRSVCSFGRDLKIRSGSMEFVFLKTPWIPPAAWKTPETD